MKNKHLSLGAWSRLLHGILLSLLIGTPSVHAWEFFWDGWHYSVTNNAAVIFQYGGTNQVVQMPHEIEGYPVVRIEENAFRQNTNIISVIISTNVNSVGPSAFSFCYNLESVVIPDSVGEIQNEAFAYCSKLAQIEIPAGVTNLGAQVLLGTWNLTNISVANNNPSFSSQDGVFFDKYKTKLIHYPQSKTNSTYSVPGSVLDIEANAFSGSTNLTWVNLVDGVTNIASGAFSACTSLELINFPASLKKIGSSAFYGCSRLSSAVIPWSLEELGGGAFSYSGISSVHFPWVYGYIEKIPGWAFASCSNLHTVNFNHNLKEIGEFAFAGCTNLRAITLHDGHNIDKIGERAFVGCGFTNIFIPFRVQTMGRSVFDMCWSLTNITASPSNPWFSDLDGVLYNENYATLVVYPAGRTNSAYSVPSGVTNLSVSAFSGASNLVTVSLPSGLTSIGDNAFVACRKLENLNLPAGLIEIGSLSFNGCLGLTQLTIPETVTWIGQDALTLASNLKRIQFLGSPPNLSGFQPSARTKFFYRPGATGWSGFNPQFTETILPEIKAADRVVTTNNTVKLRLTYRTVPGIPYTVQRSTSLTNWTTVQSVTGDGNDKMVEEETTATDRAFYKINQH